VHVGQRDNKKSTQYASAQQALVDVLIAATTALQVKHWPASRGYNALLLPSPTKHQLVLPCTNTNHHHHTLIWS
jgi:hypothetical protein